MKARRCGTALVLGAVTTALASGVGGCVTDRFPEGAPAGVTAGVAALGEETTLEAGGVEAVFRDEGAGRITVVVVPRGEGRRAG